MSNPTDDHLIYLAKQLVHALKSTHWSSWQTTAMFQQELDELKAALKEREFYDND